MLAGRLPVMLDPIQCAGRVPFLFALVHACSVILVVVGKNGRSKRKDKNHDDSNDDDVVLVAVLWGTLGCRLVVRTNTMGSVSLNTIQSSKLYLECFM